MNDIRGPTPNQPGPDDASSPDVAGKKTAKSPDAPPPGPVARLSGAIDDTRKVVGNLLLLAITALAISILIKATLKQSVIFEPISVPKELSDRGFTGEAAAKQIADEVTQIWKSADTSKRFGSIGMTSADTAPPTIEVPGTSISIDTIVYYLRDLIGRVDTKITGEITFDPTSVGAPPDPGKPPPQAKFYLRLRMVSRGFVYLEKEPTSDLAVLFKRAALPLMEQIDPYIAGLTYLHQKDYIGATRMAESELAGPPEERQWAEVLLGRVAEVQNRLDVASEQYTELAIHFPKFALPEYNLSHILFEQGLYQESIAHALKAARMDKDVRRRAIGFVNAGTALDVMRRHHIVFATQNANATEILQGIRETVKDERLLISLTRNEEPDIDLIIALCQAAIDADPLYPNAYNVWGGVERGRQNYLEATRLFEKSIAAKPTEPTGYRNIGEMYISESDWTDAATFFQKAVIINPDSYLDHHYLGRAKAGLGKYDEAEAEFTVALKLKPDYAWSHVRWAEMLVVKSNGQNGSTAEATKADAVTHLKTAGKLQPNDTSVTAEIASTYEKLGMIADAASVYKSF